MISHAALCCTLLDNGFGVGVARGSRTELWSHNKLCCVSKAGLGRGMWFQSQLMSTPSIWGLAALVDLCSLCNWHFDCFARRTHTHKNSRKRTQQASENRLQGCLSAVDSQTIQLTRAKKSKDWLVQIWSKMWNENLSNIYLLFCVFRSFDQKRLEKKIEMLGSTGLHIKGCVYTVGPGGPNLSILPPCDPDLVVFLAVWTTQIT